MSESVTFKRATSANGDEFLRLAVRTATTVKWVEFKPLAPNFAQLFSPHGEVCPNAPFELRLDGRTYLGTGEHASRLLVCAATERAYPLFRTMRPPSSTAQQQLIGEYLVKDMTLARFRDELFFSTKTKDTQKACWITDLTFDTETSLSFQLHYCALDIAHYYEDAPTEALPHDARMTVRLFFLALPTSPSS